MRSARLLVRFRDFVASARLVLQSSTELVYMPGLRRTRRIIRTHERRSPETDGCSCDTQDPELTHKHTRRAHPEDGHYIDSQPRC